MTSPQRAFDAASEAAERVLASWWGAMGYGALCALSGVIYGWDGVDRFIYITGAAIIVLLIGSGRRDWKAQHAQMEASLDDDALARLEEKSEAEIEEVRK